MAQITIGGQPAQTSGNLPKTGTAAPNFLLTKTDLADTQLTDFTGKKIILNIFPSVDTPVCSASVRKFNKEVTDLPGTVVLCVSMDLPFTHSRFCEAEGLKDVIPASELRNRKFGDDYGVRIVEGPLAGLLARAVVVIDEGGTVIYASFVKELKEEPPYDEILTILK